MLKKLLLGGFFACLIFIGPFEAKAQRRVPVNKPKYDLEPYHFGFILAGNMMNLSWKPIDGYQKINWDKAKQADDIAVNADSLKINSLQTRPIPGFSVGIVGNLRLGNHFDLRFIPTLSFGERKIDYTIQTFIQESLIETLTQSKGIQTNLVELPLELKFRSKRLNNFAAYLLAGAKYSIDMASTKKVISSSSNRPVRLDRQDIAAQAGFGFDFYTPYFKFGTELKMSYGLRNILVKDEFMYSSALNTLKNKMVQISFTFE